VAIGCSENVRVPANYDVLEPCSNNQRVVDKNLKRRVRIATGSVNVKQKRANSIVAGKKGRNRKKEERRMTG